MRGVTDGLVWAYFYTIEAYYAAGSVYGIVVGIDALRLAYVDTFVAMYAEVGVDVDFHHRHTAYSRQSSAYRAERVAEDTSTKQSDDDHRHENHHCGHHTERCSLHYKRGIGGIEASEDGSKGSGED